MSKARNYRDMILEDINSKLDAVLEMVTPLVRLPQEMRELREDVGEVKSDIKIIKAVVKSHSIQLQNHEARI